MKTKGRQETSLTINKIILKSKEKAGKKEEQEKTTDTSKHTEPQPQKDYKNHQAKSKN